MKTENDTDKTNNFQQHPSAQVRCHVTNNLRMIACKSFHASYLFHLSDHSMEYYKAITTK